MISESKCSVCGATGCKMWRQYQTFVPRIYCVEHACEDQNMDASLFTAEGLHPSDYFPGRMTDQIGWLVPALPTEDGWWGYTSSPSEAIAVWKALPTYPCR